MNDQIILAALTLAWFVAAMLVAFELARVVSRISYGRRINGRRVAIANTRRY